MLSLFEVCFMEQVIAFSNTSVNACFCTVIYIHVVVQYLCQSGSF